MRKNVWLLAILPLFISCSSQYYPAAVNAPFFEKEGEFEGNVLFGRNGTDVQLSYAATDHIAVMMNGSYKGDNNFIDSLFFYNTSNHSHLFGEVGLGYYTPLNTILRFEVFGGYGIGQFEGDYDYSVGLDDFNNSTYRKIFLQPQIGISRKIFEGGIATRLSGVFVTSDITGKESNMFFWQPTIISKVGGNHVKFMAEAGLNIPLGYREEVEFDALLFMVSFGVNVSLGN